MRNLCSIKILLLLTLLTFPLVSFSFDDIHLQKLKSLNQCKECDLRSAVLTNANLIGVNLTEAKLSGADLTEADLTEAVLYNADLSGANLFNANLNNAKLSYSRVTRKGFHD